MIRGHLSERLDPLIELAFVADNGDRLVVDAVLDTGFTAQVAAPIEVIMELGLKEIMPVEVALADGTTFRTSRFTAWIDWMDGPVEVEVLAVDGQPLVGIELLLGCRISIPAAFGGPVLAERLVN